jgi:hypothetical protein
MNNRELRTNERLRRANAPQHRAHKPHALMQLAFPQVAISVTRIERGISNRNARRLGRRVDAFAFTIVPRIGTRHFFGFKKMQKKLMLGRLDIESSSTRVRQAEQQRLRRIDESVSGRGFPINDSFDDLLELVGQFRPARFAAGLLEGKLTIGRSQFEA